MAWRISFLALVLGVMTLAEPRAAYAQDLGVPLSPVLVIDSDRMFRASQTGQKINADLEERLDTLVAENRKIEGQLVAEEQALTDLRPTMNPTEFRNLADEFDQKVQGIRAAQDAKQRELQQARDAQSQTFIADVAPILSAIGRERGALVILERRSVFLSADTIDITEEAIARINAAARTEPVPGAVPATTDTGTTPSEQSSD